MERSSAFLGPARLLPTYELGRPVKRHSLGQVVCCNAPDGKGYCFDTGSGQCVMTWVSDGLAPGSPACVLNSKGDWVPPSCLDLDPNPAPGRPKLPPGCRYLTSESSVEPQVICECYNCTTRESDGWRGSISQWIENGSKNPCLKDPQWYPKPAVCPPGGGGTYTPPATEPSPELVAAAQVPPAAQVMKAPISEESMESVPASEAPVIPANPRHMTRPAQPSGAANGSPWQTAARPRQVPMAKPSNPLLDPEYGRPVPLVKWMRNALEIKEPQRPMVMGP